MNKRQRKKQAKKKALKTGAFTPRNTFRSTMSIQSTLFDPNHPKNEKLIYLAERNLNRLAYVITKPGIVNLTNLTEDDVKYIQSPKFTQTVSNKIGRASCRERMKKSKEKVALKEKKK